LKKYPWGRTTSPETLDVAPFTITLLVRLPLVPKVFVIVPPEEKVAEPDALAV